MCALSAPDLFDQDNDGRVLLRGKGSLNDAELDAARQTVALCPSGALSLRDSTDDVRPREGPLDAAASNSRRATRPGTRIQDKK